MVIRFYLFLLALLPLSSSEYRPGQTLIQNDYIAVEDILNRPQKEENAVVDARPALEEDVLAEILLDPENRIPEEFKIHPYFSELVRFWFRIYTQYTSDQIIIHDKDDVGKIYSVLDFSALNKPGINRFAKSTIISEIVLEKIHYQKTLLIELMKNKLHGPEAAALLRKFDTSNNPPPKNADRRKKYFLDRIEGIRTQTGQRNLIQNGIFLENPFHPTLAMYFEKMKMPIQLLAIPFLESSFNNKAASKVGAEGVWQFMPLISSYFMPKETPLTDYRHNPMIATLSAIHLLKENKFLLKSWDLAVTAYNSGTKHLLLARRTLGKRDLSLEDVLKFYDHPHIGFASKNFFAEFSALVYALAYQDRIFEHKDDSRLKHPLKIFIAKCPIVLPNWYKEHLDEAPLLADLNKHLSKDKATYPRGTLVVADFELPAKKFFKVDDVSMFKLKPKEWPGLIQKGHSCSTR